MWREAFKKLRRADGNDERYDRDFWEDTIARVEACGKQQVVGKLDEPITMEEVEKAVQELRRGKAPGVDGVVNEVLKYGGVQMARALYLMFNVFFERESTCRLDERTCSTTVQRRRQTRRETTTEELLFLVWWVSCIQ